MTYETAHKILSAHQAWRRGLVDVMEYTAAEVNEALEFAITALQSDHYTRTGARRRSGRGGMQ